MLRAEELVFNSQHIFAMADTASSSCSNVQIMGRPAATSAALSYQKKTEITCTFKTMAIHALTILHLISKAIKIA